MFQHIMIQGATPSNSQVSLPHEDSFDLERAGSFTFPPLAHMSDRAAPYLSFLYPAPRSPMATHEHHVGQFRTGLVRPSSASPVQELSSSKTMESTVRKGPEVRQTDEGQACGGKAQHPTVQFDSNNIRFVAPLNPFMTQSAIKIWNEPKLSPIHGSIINPTSPPKNSAPESSKAATDAVAGLLKYSPTGTRGTVPNTPIPQDKKMEAGLTSREGDEHKRDQVLTGRANQENFVQTRA